MDKQPYYVSVGSGEIHSDPTVATYQYKIEASNADVRRLNALFNRANDASSSSFFQFARSEYDKNSEYDSALSSVYQMIYDLGDDTAKEHIETMNILQ